MENLISAIRIWNPWWISTWAFPRTIEREITGKIISVIKTTHIKDIIGIRRSGKSTLMIQLIELQINGGSVPNSIVLLNFEDPVIRNASFTIR